MSAFIFVAALVVAGVAGAVAGVTVDRYLLRRWVAANRPGGIPRSPGGARAQSPAGVPPDGGGVPSRRRDSGPTAGNASARDALKKAWAGCERSESGRAAARRAALRLTAGLDSLRSGVVVCDPRGRIVARNTAVDAFVAARHGEALVADAIEDLLDRALDGRSDDVVVELSGDPHRSYEVTAAPVVRGGEPLGAVALVHDVTQQRRIDAVRRDFVANVSHELKTPLGALCLLAESLSADADPEVIAAMAVRIQSEARRAADTVDDLLTLSYIEHTGGRLDELVDVGGVLRECLERVGDTAERCGVNVSCTVADAPVVVSGSHVQLVSALFNLIDNAIKFTDPGGAVDVSIDRDGDGGDADVSMVRIVVRDNGMGIPASAQPRIFERFYRVDRARDRYSGGTGLGLSIVRHAVLNHGGEIEVSSREGAGSAFTVSLPASCD